MNDDLENLYGDIILEHSTHPSNFGKLDVSTHSASGDNPICGDSVEVFLEVEDSVVKDIRFESKGCAISVASASLMTESVKGKSLKEAKEIFTNFHDFMLSKEPSLENLDSSLQALAGVKRFPMRVKCVTLSWHTLLKALDV